MNPTLLSQIRKAREAIKELTHPDTYNDDALDVLKGFVNTVESQINSKTPALLRQKEGVS